MAGSSPRDFAEWMQKVERQTSAALRTSGRAAEAARVVHKELADIGIPGTPTAPVELTAQSSVYLDVNGRWRGRVDIDFPDVTRTVDGTDITVQGYEAYAYREDAFPEGTTPVWELFGTGDSSTITRRELPQGVWYVIKVRALTGVWSSTIRVQTTRDTTPPPQTTAPTAVANRGVITVHWDGNAVTGEMPADLDVVILVAGSEPSPGIDKAVARFDDINRIFILAEIPYYTPMYFRLVAMDQSGNLSPWSEQATAFTTPLVDMDVVLTEIDAAKTEIKNAGQILLEDGITLTASLEANKALGDSAIRGLPFVSLDAPIVEAGDGRPVGATWQRLNEAGKQIGFWRWDGEAWLEMGLDPSVIPVIQIGSGTAGDMDIARLTTTSAEIDTAVIDKLWADFGRFKYVTADMLLVGKKTNLIPNGDLSQGLEGWDADWGLYTGDPNVAAFGSHGSIWLLGNKSRGGASFPLKAGARYRFSVWARGSVVGKTFFAQMTTNSTTAALPNPYAISGQSLTLGYVKYTGEVVAPAGATSGRILIYGNHQGGVSEEGYSWFSGFELHELNEVSMIVDGKAVIRELTVAEQLTVTLLSAHKIEAHEIDVNSLRADTAWMGSLRTGLLVADVISAIQIQANAVSAENLQADAITAKHTITGAVIRTDAAANTGIRIDSSVGIRGWTAAGSESMRWERSTGNITIYAGTIQTTATANRGVKFSAAGLNAWDSAGNLMFNLDSATGRGRFSGRMATGPSTEAGITIVPPAEASGRSGIWFTKQAGIVGGEETAGAWIDAPTGTTVAHLHLRGKHGGGVEVENRLIVQGDSYLQITRGGASGRGYVLQEANGSYFSGSVNFNGGIDITTSATTLAGNAYLDGNGKMWRSSSAARYKIDARPSSLPDSLLELDFKDWIDKGQLDQYAEISDLPRPLSEADTRTMDLTHLGRVGGVVAEDVEQAAGAAAELFVTYDPEGRIEGVAYDRLGVALALKLADKVNDLAADLAALKEEA